MPTHHNEPLLERYQREHRTFGGMSMSRTTPPEPDESGTEYAKMHAKWRKGRQELANLNRAHEETVSELRRLSAINAELLEALAWYEEQARLCRLIHSEGDAGRNALASDGGKVALAAIAKAQGEQP